MGAQPKSSINGTSGSPSDDGTKVDARRATGETASGASACQLRQVTRSNARLHRQLERAQATIEAQRNWTFG